MGEKGAKVEISYVNPKNNKIPFPVKNLLLILVILLLIIFTSNYFNLISLSAIYQPLSSLPRQQTKQKSVTPVPDNYSANTFSYNKEKANTLLKKYVKDSINSDFLPSDYEKIAVNQFDKSPNLFTMSFAAKDANISTFLRHETSGDIFSISIKLNDGLPTTSATTVNPLLSSYFVKSYSVSGCSQTGILTYCGDFQTTPEGKENYGINTINGPKKSFTTLYACRIPKDSNYYHSAENCVF